MSANKSVCKPKADLIKKTYLYTFSKAGKLDEAELGPLGFGDPSDEPDDLARMLTDSSAAGPSGTGPSQVCASPSSDLGLPSGLLRTTPPRPMFSRTPSPTDSSTA